MSRRQKRKPGARKTAGMKSAGKNKASAMKKAGKGIFQKKKQSASLKKITGVQGDIARTEATRKIWNYIKRNDMQDDKERRKIVIPASDDLAKVLGSGRVDMLKVAQKLSDHLS